VKLEDNLSADRRKVLDNNPESYNSPQGTELTPTARQTTRKRKGIRLEVRYSNVDATYVVMKLTAQIWVTPTP